jgi:GAF domain-containing protein
MHRLFGRFAWRNLSLPVKTGLLFLIQMGLIGVMGIVALAGQAAVRRELNTALVSSVEMRGLVQDLQINMAETRQLETQLVQERFGWAAFSTVRPRLEADYQALVDQIEADAARLDDLAASFLPEDEQRSITVDASAVASNAQTRQRNFVRMLNLVDQLLAETQELQTQGTALEMLTHAYEDPELNGQIVTMRSMERGLAAGSTQIELSMLEDAANQYIDVYQGLPDDARSYEVPLAIEFYLEQADGVADVMQQLNAAYAISRNTLEVAYNVTDDLGTTTEAVRAEQIDRVEAIQRNANTITLIGLVITTLLGGTLTYLFGRDLAHGAQGLLRNVHELEAGNFAARAPVRGQDEFSQLSEGFNMMARELEGMVGGLEQRVAARTRDLSITAEIGRTVTEARNPQDLMRQVVSLIRDRFGYYHAQVFLVDDAGENANLVASTGTAGRELLARRHSLPVGSQSVIGQVTDHGEPIVALDTDRSQVHRRNELLPDTRSEMALPMRVGNRVIGALDVQSVAPNAFDEDVIAVFQSMADQLAVALENARLRAALVDMQTGIEALERRATLEAWETYHAARMGEGAGALAFTLEDEDAGTGNGVPDGLLREALARGRVVTGQDENGRSALAVPIRVRGQVIGVFGFGGESLRQLAPEDLTLVEDVAARVGIALDNLRLVEDASRRAEHETLLNEISAKIAGSTDIEDILQTTVKELGRVLRAPQTSVQLRGEEV